MITKTGCILGSVLGSTFKNHAECIHDSHRRRLNVHSESYHCDGIARKVKAFFTHAYADCRMYFRAFSSLARSVKPEDINLQMDALFEFKTIVENSGNDQELVSDSFNQLSLSNLNRFFLVNKGYMHQFVMEKDAVKIQNMKEEILRECGRIFAFQRIMLGIKSVLTRIFPPSSQHNRGSTSHTTQTHSAPTRSTTGSTSRTKTGIDVNIPGTVPYVAGNIPQSVKDKANEITALLTQLGDSPNIPNDFNCPISQDVTAIPIIDASHPNIQQQLKDKLPLVGLHVFDADSLEALFANGAGRWGPGVKCPTCRHPENGSIKREYLRIYTQRQDEILAHLKRLH